MRKANLIAILATAISGVTALDKILGKPGQCMSYAIVDDAWVQNNLTRRRVIYDTTGMVPHYDQTMYSIGWMWSNEKKPCNARAIDTNVYFHGAIIRGGAYVIDSSEESSEDGDRAHQCLLKVFKVTLGNNVNCPALGV